MSYKEIQRTKKINQAIDIAKAVFCLVVCGLVVYWAIVV